MSRKSGRSLSTDWEALRRQVEAGKRQPNELPVALGLRAIRLWPKVFQHRSPGGHTGKAHIRQLADVIRKSRVRTLDPVTVWWDGKGWACVDGHHRHAAYIEAAVGPDHPVPVEVFEGTLEEAITLAASANSRNKLSMTSAEKSNAAWRMVAMTGLSKATIARASGVSESTVANMRRVRSQLESRSVETADDLTVLGAGDFRDLTWADARRLAEGRESADFDRDQANEKKAQEMALALRKALGKEGQKYPLILARALEIYDSRLEDALMDYWGAREESEGVPEEVAEF